MSEIDLGDGVIEVEGLGTPPASQGDVTNLDGKDDATDLNKDGGLKPGEPANLDTPPAEDGTTPPAEGSEEVELTEGMEIEFGDTTYKVDANGNIVDDKGVIFKEAKDAKAWIQEQSLAEEDDDFSIENVSKELGINILDAKGKPVEFSNDEAGFKAFIKSAIEVKSKEVEECTINKYLSENPVVKSFVDYVTVNGDYKGFGQMPDRSGITLDENNVEQLKSVIKMAAKEFGINGINDTYIKYLEDNGSLFEEAKNQLTALTNKDKEVRTKIAAEAEASRQEQIKTYNEYYAKVNEKITSKNIGGYIIPDTFVKNVDGKNITLTPKDFYKFVSTPTEKLENGDTITGYMKALQSLTPEQTMDKELIDAYLMFTGGDYKSLVDMIAKEEKVRKLRIISAENRSKKIVFKGKSNVGKGDKANITFE